LEGTVQKIDGGYILRFERRLKHPVEKVWAAITEPERLADWLANAEIELVEGGKMELRFGNTGHVMNGKVTRVHPPTLLEYGWNSKDAEDTLVRWELHPVEDGCLLVLTHTFRVPDTLPKMAAGWHVHLDILSSALMGQPMEWPWSSWEEWHTKYEKTFG
jgi:uncharacterized protein YndB with AHSA1/START domain